MADKQYLDKQGLTTLVEDYLKPEDEFSATSEHPVMNRIVTNAFTDTLATINNDKATGYYHFENEESLPISNSMLTNNVYQTGQRAILDSDGSIYEASVDSDGNVTWDKINMELGSGKVNATALVDGQAIAEAENGFYLNVEDGKVYEVKDGEVIESSKEIDHCIIDYGVYRENKDSLDQLDIIFVITNAPASGSGDSSSNITDDWIDCTVVGDSYTTNADNNNITAIYSPSRNYVHINGYVSTKPVEVDKGMNNSFLDITCSNFPDKDMRGTAGALGSDNYIPYFGYSWTYNKDSKKVSITAVPVENTTLNNSTWIYFSGLYLM